MEELREKEQTSGSAKECGGHRCNFNRSFNLKFSFDLNVAKKNRGGHHCNFNEFRVKFASLERGNSRYEGAEVDTEQPLLGEKPA